MPISNPNTILTPREIIDYNVRIRLMEEIWSQWCGCCGTQIQLDDADFHLVGDYYYHGRCLYFVLDKNGRIAPTTRRPH